jgi:polyribonucleotide nucleotidyltransferase
MGLLKEGDNVAVLSDILGDEDHAGDMDFKVCGTKKGITALQMDIKIDGINEQILRKALQQAKDGRFFIIDKMKETLAEPRKELSQYAPRIITMKIRPDRIRDLIGTGGKNIRQIVASNGSSSMASVCGGALSLMDAGVPVKDVVAGIAMGLLKEGDNVAVLSDILGDEDHAGDMDFKVCGTKKGITALQMDIKIDGINEQILRKALQQAKDGRFFIIDKMKETLAEPRKELSQYAPRIITMKIRPDRIRDLIGTGGKNIRQIVAETGVSIDVEDDGTVLIASTDLEAADRAIAMVKWLTEEAEIGKIYMGTVKKVVDFGAFVEILPGTEGLVHISQLDTKRVAKVTDVVKEGDKIPVKVIEIDSNGKIRLSRKDALGADVPKNSPF